MSVGELCSCPRMAHPPSGQHECRRYSTDQGSGGPCPSCAIGYHMPCGSEPVLAGLARVGDCLRCRWHSSQHR